MEPPGPSGAQARPWLQPGPQRSSASAQPGCLTNLGPDSSPCLCPTPSRPAAPQGGQDRPPQPSCRLAAPLALTMQLGSKADLPQRPMANTRFWSRNTQREARSPFGCIFCQRSREAALLLRPHLHTNMTYKYIPRCRFRLNQVRNCIIYKQGHPP